MSYRIGDDWCMNAPVKVDESKVTSMGSDKNYRCPSCKRRVKMKQYDYAPYGSKLAPIWHWPAHKIRKTKR